MLCDKCHTAMDATDTICKSCGNHVQKLNRNWSKFAKISVITLIIAASGTYIALYNMGLISLDFIGNIFGGAGVVEEVLPAEPGYTGQEAEAGGDAEDAVIPLRRDAEELAIVLSGILAAVDNYMRDFSTFNPIVSSMGYLHNATSSEYITIELLQGLGYLDEEYLAEDVLILYLRPRDLMAFDEVSFEGGATQADFLTVFVAHEVPRGIGLFSRFGAQMIFRENLNQLFLNDYNPNNGAVWRPGAQDAVYHLVAGAISDENQGEEAFIRYLAVDEMHGFVAFTLETSNHERVINYIFELVFEDYGLVGASVLATGFEHTLHPKVAINGAAPNFNFELMPDYDITAVNLVERGSPMFAALFAAMEQNGQLYEGGLPIFAAVAEGFAYIVHEGNAFFGQYNDGWSIVPVDDWRAAENLMAANVNNPPLYIIWQH